MNFRSAFLLGDEFTIQEARYLSRGVKMEDWCSVGLAQIGESEPRGALVVPLPGSPCPGETPHCAFIAGSTITRPSSVRPSPWPPPRPAAWELLGQVDLGRLEAVSQSLEDRPGKGPGHGHDRLPVRQGGKGRPAAGHF